MPDDFRDEITTLCYDFTMIMDQLVQASDDIFLQRKMPYDHVICDEDEVVYLEELWERRYHG